VRRRDVGETGLFRGHLDESAGRQPTWETRLEPLPSLDEPPSPADERRDQVGPWRIVRVLGQGGMGVVYEARHEITNAAGALKFIRPGLEYPGMLQRFEREMRFLLRLDHPNIVKVMDAGSAVFGGRRIPYFVMELIPGNSITQYAEAQRASTSQRVKLFLSAADAIAYLHSQNILKRDIKPVDILVSRSGEVKLVDFGIARPFGNAPEPYLTEAGALIGTPQYMSPEQAQAMPIDERSDVYGLGVVLFELLTGRLPYDISHHGLEEGMRMILQQAPPRLGSIRPELRGDLEWICDKALAKQKEDRYQSVQEFGDDLRRYLSYKPISAAPRTGWYVARKFLQRWLAYHPRHARSVSADY
jgi:serine/threonine protein kinase